MTKPSITINSIGAGGNIYAILARVRSEMRRLSLMQEYNDLYGDVMNCQSFEEAIERIRRDVDLIDADGKI